MSQYIKKVGVTPVRGNGFIVDSFHTNDDKKFNAPSLGAVEDRADNNLLFSSSFSAFNTSGYNVNGWSIEGDNAYTGDIPAAFLPITGLMLPANFSGTLKSPRFMPTNPYRSVYKDRNYSLTILYRVGVLPDMTSEPLVGKIENIVNDTTYVKTFGDSLRVEFSYIAVNGRFTCDLYNLTEYPIHIDSIKYELGPTATSFESIGKDQGVVDTIAQMIENATNITTPIRVVTFATPQATIYSGTESYVQGVVDIAGYKTEGVLAVRPIYTEDHFLDVISWSISVDPEDNVRKFRVLFRNSTPYDITFNLQATVLYTKIEEPGNQIFIETYETKNSKVLQNGEWVNFTGNLIKDGYTAKGILGVAQNVISGDWLDIVAFYIANDTDDIRKAFICVNNTSGAPIEAKIRFTVLWVKD